MADEQLQLDVWGGDWDLPSVDHDCLTIMTNLKFAGVPFKLNKCNNPLWSPSGTLPVLHHCKEKVSKVPCILNYLQQKKILNNDNLSKVEIADTTAFCALLEEKLLPAILHTWWVDQETLNEVTRPWYCQATGFPLNFYVPNKMQKLAEETVYITEQIDPLNITRGDIEAKIYKDAIECLNHLSYRLGDENFFFGDKPSVLDARVFGCIYPLIKAPLKSKKLSNHLYGCDNLFSFCNRIMMRYFPLSPEEFEAKRKREEEKRKMEADDSEFPNKGRDKILAAIFALTVMAVYATSTGIIQIQVVPADQDVVFED